MDNIFGKLTSCLPKRNWFRTPMKVPMKKYIVQLLLSYLFRPADFGCERVTYGSDPLKLKSACV